MRADFGAALPTVAPDRSLRSPRTGRSLRSPRTGRSLRSLRTLSSRGVLRFFAPLTGLARLAAAAFLAATWRGEVFLGSVLLAARSRSSFRARGFFLGEVEEVMKPFRYLYVRSETRIYLIT